ncbi:hypothetical protein ALP72_02280 [Pseudomonas coronafaciens pv. coronafaciens]|uniref:hypothetical protein n=1 Tax=Pseudomonas coronafaciens TaxID=53409 RepID=UPI000F00A119|nr:hypothetical protein [Pseudomonas coronafaciens]RMS11806.1 hypothetical protein ALP72_02280 [Pseudomonas coronafaciens pv. coronafaciens]
MMSKLEVLAKEREEKDRRIEEEAKRTKNDNAPIEIEKRLSEAKAELELLKPYLKTLKRMKTWDEMQKEIRKNKSA